MVAMGVVVARVGVVGAWVLCPQALGVWPVLLRPVRLLVVVLCVRRSMQGISFWAATSPGSIVRAMGGLA